MMTTNDRVKRFRSCFICGVELNDKYIVLEDSGRNQFIIDRNNKEAVNSFVFWFKNVYLKGIPQVLSILEYSIVEKNDAESICIVNRIIANPNVASLLYNDNDDDNNKLESSVSKEN